MFLDLAFRVSPLSVAVLQSVHVHGPPNPHHTIRGAFKYFLCGTWCSLIPISNSASISNAQFVSMFLFWFFTLAFVPISRVLLYDHSVEQVCFGGIIGFVEAFLWFFFVRKLAWRYHRRVGETWPLSWRNPLLLHNY